METMKIDLSEFSNPFNASVVLQEKKKGNNITKGEKDGSIPYQPIRNNFTTLPLPLPNMMLSWEKHGAAIAFLCFKNINSLDVMLMLWLQCFLKLRSGKKKWDKEFHTKCIFLQLANADRLHDTLLSVGIILTRIMQNLF